MSPNQNTDSGVNPRRKHWLSALLPAPPSTNYNLDHHKVDPYSLLPKNAVVLDIGSGELRGRYAFAKDLGRLEDLRFIHLDVCKAAGVNLLGNGMRLPIKAMSVDFVACVSVLEYVSAPQMLVDEAYRVLKPGGLLYLSAPFVFPFHPPPDDLFRFSFQGLRTLAERFEPISSGSNRGPASTFCHLCVRFFAILLSFNSRRAYGVLLYLFTWAFAWIKYLDRWIGHYKMANVMFGSGLFLGRKPPTEGMTLAEPASRDEAYS